jgi:uncharacterized membrane protein
MMMNTPIETAPVSQDDRLMAGLCHILGLIVAIIVWATQKERKFVAFQAMQAITFDLALMAVFLVFFACTFCAMFGGFGLVFPASIGLSAASQRQGDLSNPLAAIFMLIAMAITFLPFAMIPVLMLVALGVFALRIYAAVSVISGRDFRYPVLGKRLERYLARQA